MPCAVGLWFSQILIPPATTLSRTTSKVPGTPGPKVIGDEISIRKGHTYRIVVSDMERRRPIWFGGEDRSAQSMDQFHRLFHGKKGRRMRLTVMEMWKAFRNTMHRHAPQAPILFDKFC